MDIQSKYLSAFKTIDSEQLQGYSATIDDIYYQVLDQIAYTKHKQHSENNLV